MKRIMAFTVAMLLVVALCACDNGGNQQTQPPKDDDQATTAATNSQATEQSSGNIEFLNCRFANKVCAADGEYTAMLYQRINGQIYVDLIFSVNNQTSREISGKQISGWLVYQDKTISLQYCRENSISTSVDESPVLPGEHAYVHLFTRLPAEAEKENITVYYKVNGQQYQCDVFAKDTRNALDAKTEVHVGDVFKVPYSSCEFEVLEAEVIDNLQASNQKDTYYKGPYIIVKFQVTNNHPTHTVKDIFGYTESDGKYYRLSTEVEINNKTEFEPLSYNGIVPGASKTVYIFTRITDDLNNNMVVRFNLAGSCYYVKIQ